MATLAVPPTTSRTLLFETTLLSAVRCVYFLVSKHYVNRSLFADLRSVTEDSCPAEGGGALESPTRATIALEEVVAGGGYSAAAATGAGGKGGEGLSAPTLKRGNSAGMGKREPTGTTSPGSPKGFNPTQQQVYTKLSTTLFCLSFSESCMLFTLLLFGDAVSDR